MEPYIYYGKLPLIEEGPTANYASKLESTEVTVSIRFAKISWKADMIAMGFQIDAAFPTIGEYSQISEVRVSKISPSAPDGPTILVSVTGSGTVGLPLVLTPQRIGRQPYDYAYVQTLPKKIRDQIGLIIIISDVVFIQPTAAPFTTEDKDGRTYSGVGRERTRNIVTQHEFFGMVGVAGGTATTTAGQTVGVTTGQSAVDTSGEQYDGLSGRTRYRVIDWVEVTDIVYEDGGPPPP